MLKDLPIDKFAAGLIAYLTLLSICYNNGYWSVFYINIFNYYGLQDILKGVIAPFFQFGALILLPITTMLLMIALAYRKKSERSNTEQEVKTRPRWAKILISIARFTLRSIIATVIIGVVGMSLLIFPIEDQGQFLWLYMSELHNYNLLRATIAILVVPMYGAILFVELDTIDKLAGLRIGAMLSCFVLTLFIAYHYGKADAYKIVSGYEFLYLYGKKNTVYKYLGKVGNYNFFLINNNIITHKAVYDFTIPVKLNTLSFNPSINIIADDSLKSVRFTSYSANNTLANDTSIYKSFLILNAK